MDTDLTQLRPLSVSNLKNLIEQRVRDAILSGTFRPGQRLVETTIADQLGVSRAPLREVMSALEREGLVVNIPRRGNFVIDFADKDIEEIYSLRNLLEVGALRRGINRFTPEDLAKMQSIVDSLGELTGQRYDHQQVVTLDLIFHEHICRVADHGRLFQVWNSMRLQTQLLIGLTSRTHLDQPGEPREHHQTILNAIKDADLQRAEINLTEHMQDAQRRAWMALQQTRSLESDLG